MFSLLHPREADYARLQASSILSFGPFLVGTLNNFAGSCWGNACVRLSLSTANMDVHRAGHPACSSQKVLSRLTPGLEGEIHPISAAQALHQIEVADNSGDGMLTMSEMLSNPLAFYSSS